MNKHQMFNGPGLEGSWKLIIVVGCMRSDMYMNTDFHQSRESTEGSSSHNQLMALTRSALAVWLAIDCFSVPLIVTFV